jgi:hypothetical protein
MATSTHPSNHQPANLIETFRIDVVTFEGRSTGPRTVLAFSVQTEAVGRMLFGMNLETANNLRNEIDASLTSFGLNPNVDRLMDKALLSDMPELAPLKAYMTGEDLAAPASEEIRKLPYTTFIQMDARPTFYSFDITWTDLQTLRLSLDISLVPAFNALLTEALTEAEAQ